MEFELTLLGTNSALPAYGRFPTAQVLKCPGGTFLIDCGEGAQIRMQEFGVKRAAIGQIFISHLHGDHIFGLPGLLSSFSLNGRTSPLQIYAPPGLADYLLMPWKHLEQDLPFPLELIEIDTQRHQCIFSNNKVEVFSIPLKHRVSTSGFLFKEVQGQPNFNADALQHFALDHHQIRQLKAGEDIKVEGKTLRAKDWTFPPPSGRSYAFCSDTDFEPAIASLIEGVDLLYHESTFLRDESARARKTMHSTTEEAAKIALAAGAKRLVLGHYSSRYSEVEVFEREARQVFPKTIAGLDGSRFEILRQAPQVPDQNTSSVKID